MKFKDLVLSTTERIPPGRVTSYGELARALGNVRFARAVGGVLNRNPEPIKVPCHRVVCSDGRVGGYSRGVSEKIRLLRSEGISIRERRIQNFESVFFSASELRST